MNVSLTLELFAVAVLGWVAGMALGALGLDIWRHTQRRRRGG